MKYYAVIRSCKKNGLGIYTNWEDCKAVIPTRNRDGSYQKFDTLPEAEAFLRDSNVPERYLGVHINTGHRKEMVYTCLGCGAPVKGNAELCPACETILSSMRRK